MTAASRRYRYGRLCRLPSVRAAALLAAAVPVPPLAAAALGAGAGATALAALAAPAAAAAGVLAGRRRYGARVALELRLARALVATRPRAGHGPVPGADARTLVGPGGVTRIEAGSWLGAVHALGWSMARDRAFQMDLMRRTAAGRMAEVWGRTVLPSDRRFRQLGLRQAADSALAALEPPERELLEAFAAGVNAAWEQDGPPFESRFLGYRPEPWAPRDSLLVELLMFHGLSWNEQAKRAEAVIRRALPEPVAEFFVPGHPDRRPELPADLARHRAAAPVADGGFVVLGAAVAGSNCWVGTGPQGPVLACDPHLTLTAPNLLYEVDLAWQGRRLRGLAPAGLPAVLTGTNGTLTWGVTNLSADVLDLVPPEADGTDETSDEVTTEERIRVRGRADEVVAVTRRGTMPVSPTPLLGERVALRWTGHDPRSCDLKFQRLAHADDVGTAMGVLEQAEGIALNVLLADAEGRMAHLATGLLPRRPADGVGPADGHLRGTERPRLVDPPSGVLVSANDAALPEGPFRIGYDLDPGYRARRLREVLTDDQPRDPAAMRALQHDTAAELYLPYRDHAVAALAGVDDALADALAAWDGTADAGSSAFAVLVRFREVVVRRILAPYLAACRELDPGFVCAFRSLDRPVLAVLASGDPALLPREAEQAGQRAFLAECAAQAVAELVELSAPADGADRLPPWGALNEVGLNHPLEGLVSWAAPLLGVAPAPQSGALHTVRACAPGFAAVGRAVLTPGPDGVADFELPGGQSGHPLSPHFADRHPQWVRTIAQPVR